MTSKNRQRITPDRVTDGNTAAGEATADTKDRPAKGARLLWQLYWAWFRMGLFTFGGGYAMLPMIQKEVIDRYHWADEEEVLDYYAVGQCTPGAIAVNTATFIGYKVAGTAGGIISTLGVITPSLLIISVIASLLNHFADYPVVQHALAGIRVAVCVLMFVSIEKLLKSGVKGISSWIIFAAAFVLSYITGISTVVLVVMAGAAGYAIFIMQKKRKIEPLMDDIKQQNAGIPSETDIKQQNANIPGETDSKQQNVNIPGGNDSQDDSGKDGRR
ncbi:MAG: chromate transporter [Lachnospiraceae bacterium]|nr:chromate transporter [Lachnospiraceae bacterium]